MFVFFSEFLLYSPASLKSILSPSSNPPAAPPIAAPKAILVATALDIANPAPRALPVPTVANAKVPHKAS
jgi:hypothetical protein